MTHGDWIAIGTAVLSAFTAYVLASINNKSEAKKQIEQYKLESRNYITKTKFDLEVKIWQEILAAISDTIETTNIMFSPLNTTLEIPSETNNEFRLQIIKQHLNNTRQLSKLLIQNSAFLPADLWNEINDVTQQFMIQYEMFNQLYSIVPIKTSDSEIAQYYGNLENETPESCKKRTMDINVKCEEWSCKLRKYLNELEIK